MTAFFKLRSLALTFTVTVAATYCQEVNDQSAKQQWPVAIYAEHATSATVAKSLPSALPIQEPEPGASALPVIADSLEPQSDVPVNADAIVIGRITDASAHIQPNGIRSEYKISVNTVLKGLSANTVGTIVTVGRPGGAVLFPSGKTEVFRHHGKASLKVDSEYVLFLKRGNAGAYDVLTAYRLSNGKAWWIDGQAAGAHDVPASALDGSDEDTFRNRVKQLTSK